jgi:hypothetical protein
MTIVYDEHYIRVVDHALDDETCDTLIDLFESNPEFHVELPYLQMPLHGLVDMCVDPAQDVISNVIHQQLASYRRYWDPLHMMPEHYGLEGYKIKAYRPNEHEMALHVDQMEQFTARRFLGFLFYLNDNEAGTEFPLIDYNRPAKKGTLLIHPPGWQNPHRGIMPTKSTKYIITGYTVYV